MNVLHIGPIWAQYADGPSRSILGIARAQAGLGHKVAVLPSDPPSIAGDVEIPDLPQLPSPRHRLVNPWRTSRRWEEAILEAFGEPDLVNFHCTNIPFHAALAKLCLRRGWPYVETPRGNLTRQALKVSRVKKAVANWLYVRPFLRRAKGVQALSERERREIQAFDPRLHTYVLPNGIDESLIDMACDLVESAGSDPVHHNAGDIVVCFLGKLQLHIKGLDLLLSAIRTIQGGDVGRHMRFVLIGPAQDPADGQGVKSLVSQLPMPDRVTLTGGVYGEEKWKLLAASDVFILPSRTEGMPMCVLEAMAFAKPCIVTPGSSMQDVIGRCNGGWLCDGTAESIADTLTRVYRDREQIDERGRDAQACARSEFTWPVVAKRSIAIFEELIRARA